MMLFGVRTFLSVKKRNDKTAYSILYKFTKIIPFYKFQNKNSFLARFLYLKINMKITANTPKEFLLKRKSSIDFQERVSKIISTKWKLKTIYETGLITDEAVFKDVDVVFSHYNIYALYGNRVDKYKYKFLTKNTFLVNIEGVDVKCRIKTFTKNKFQFHVDFKNSHFIVELESDN